MALIKCQECGKEISSKANACPACGCPVSESGAASSKTVERPAIADDLSIGKQVTNWSGNAAVKGFFDPLLNSDAQIPEGKGSLLLHKAGLTVAGMLYQPILQIHFSQIISIENLPQAEMFEKDKSVVKRAIVGTVLLGPLGAILGGMSGIGTKKVFRSTVIVNYWDIKSASPYTLLLSTDDEATAKKFCANLKKQLS